MKSSEAQAEFKAIIRALKRVLKERGISYRALAKQLGLSESGLKKIFSGDDCSFRRLSQITRVLGFRVTDLLDEIDRTELKSVRFTPDQQQFFLKHMGFFNFYLKLVIERQSVAEIRGKFGIDEAMAFKYLRKLDELRLIRLLPGDQIKLPSLVHVRDFGAGPLLSKVYREWGQALVEDLADPKFQASGNFIIRCLKMKDETHQELLRRLQELDTEFLRRALREMSVSTGKLKPVRWMSLTDQLSYVRKIP